MLIKYNQLFIKFTFSICLLLGSIAYTFSQDVFLYEDKNSDWEISDAIGSSEFSPIDKMSIQSEITKSTFWIKITPQKPFTATNRILFSNSINHFKTIYFQNRDNEITSYTFGVNQINESSTLLPSFSLNNSVKNIYIQISSDSFIFESFHITSELKTNKSNSIFIFTQTFYFVIIFLTFIYISFTWLKSKRKVLAYYLFYLFSLLFMFFYASNIGGYLVWDQLPFSSSYLESFGTSIMISTYILLTLQIAQIKRISKRLFQFTIGIVLLEIVIVLLLWAFADYASISTFANIYPGIGLLLIITFGVLGIVNKNKNSYLLFSGIMAVFSSGVLKLSINWGLVSYSVTLDFMTYLGFLVEVFIFTYLVLKQVELEVKLTQEQRLKLEQNASEISELHLQLSKLANENNDHENNAGFTISPDINELLHTPLTKREMEVLMELANGGKYDDVAERLFISKTTLKSHISKIYVKLDTKNRIDAINEALKLTAQLQEG